MKISRRIVTSVVAALATTTALVACGSSTTTDGARELRLGTPAAPPTLDPAGMTEGQMLQFAQATYDSLLVVDAQGQVEPNVATDWSYTADLKSLTLHVRQGIEFTDGTPLDASAVVTGLEHIKGGTGTGAQQLLNVSGVSAVDPGTVRIDLAKPDPALLYSLGTFGGFLASPAAIAAGTLDAAPVGSGPYTLSADETVTGAAYVYTRNQKYWNSDAFAFDRISLTVMDTSGAMLNALKSGQIDGMFGYQDMRDDAVASGLTVNVGSPVNWAGYIMADRDGKDVPQLADVRVRQAINYAINRKGIVDTFYRDGGIPTTQIFGPESDAWSAALNDAYPYDPQKARQLLADAGVGQFTLPVASFPRLLDKLQPIVQQQLADVGITVRWNSIAPGEYRTGLLGSPMFPMSMSINPSPWTDIQNLVTPTAQMNGRHVQTPQLDGLLAAAQNATDDAARTAAYREINRYLVEQAWFAPIVAINGLYFSAPTIAVTMHNAQVVPSLRDYAPVG